MCWKIIMALGKNAPDHNNDHICKSWFFCPSSTIKIHKITINQAEEGTTGTVFEKYEKYLTHRIWVDMIYYYILSLKLNLLTQRKFEWNTLSQKEFFMIFFQTTWQMGKKDYFIPFRKKCKIFFFFTFSKTICQS